MSTLAALASLAAWQGQDERAQSTADVAIFGLQEFLSKSEQLFRTHPVWRGSLPAVLDQAVEVGRLLL